MFINYRGSDAASSAAFLHAELSDRFGADSVFLDYESLALGYDFIPQLLVRVRRCAVLLVVVGDRWLDGEIGQRPIDDPSDWVRREIQEALERDIPVVPVLFGGAELNAVRLPAELAGLSNLQYFEIRNRRQRQDIKGLGNYLARQIPRLREQPVPVPNPQQDLVAGQQDGFGTAPSGADHQSSETTRFDREQIEQAVSELGLNDQSTAVGADAIPTALDRYSTALAELVAQSPAAPVVGPVPREPRHFQQPTDAVRALTRLAGEAAAVCAVTGLRGVGKTQAAGAYARQRIDDGWLVAWIPAHAENLVVSGLVELADALGLRQTEDTTKAVTARVRNHLQTRREPALLVFDNVTDPAHVIPHLPAAGGAQIVLTSASRAIDQIGTRVPVELFNPTTAVRFLSTSTGIRDEAGARELAIEVGYLPLALAQAAARIIRVDRDYATYLRRHRSVSVDQLLTARPGDAYPLGAAEAILLALESVATGATSGETVGALDVLDLLSVLSPDGITRGLLTDLVADRTAASPHDDDHARAVDEILDRLFDASLIEFAGKHAAVVVMHRLTQRILRDRANQDTPAMLDRAASLLRRRGTFPYEQAWRRRDRGEELTRHITTIWDHTSAVTPSARNLYDILALRRWASRQATGSADLDRAIDLAAEVRTYQHDIHGSDHPDTLTAVNDLARAFEAAGRLDEAIALFERNLTDRRRLLGEDHPDTLTSINNLAYAYDSAVRPDEATPLLERNLTDRRRLLGEDHPDTLTSINNLARVYEATGRRDEAIALFEKNLTDRRRLLGENHPDGLRSAFNLARVYTLAGRHDEAIVLFEKNLTDRRRLLGDDHPDTLRTANSLAYAYTVAGRPDVAMPLHEQNLADTRRVLGGDHPDTLTSVNNLARTYEAAGRLDEAVRLLEQNLTDTRRVLGNDHPHTLTSTNDLAHAYQAAGQPDKAIPLFEQVSVDREQVPGSKHQPTSRSHKIARRLRMPRPGNQP